MRGDVNANRHKNNAERNQTVATTATATTANIRHKQPQTRNRNNPQPPDYTANARLMPLPQRAAAGNICKTTPQWADAAYQLPQRANVPQPPAATIGRNVRAKAVHAEGNRRLQTQLAEARALSLWHLPYKHTASYANGQDDCPCA